MPKRILIEASGSPVSAYMIRAIQESGHICVASDISINCAAYIMADEFVVFPRKNDQALWEKVESILVKNGIDIVIPSFDEMLLGWSERKEYFARKGIHVLISSSETIKTFQDKWTTFEFFNRYDLPCAETSLDAIYPLVKPRFGRGSVGIFIEYNDEKRQERFSHDDISQQILTGEEYTVDCLFDHQHNPVYILPRKRLDVVNGKSTGGVVEQNQYIEKIVIDLSKHIELIGPINIQFFVDGESISLVEVNPRIAGGMALGFAASTNWVPLCVDILEGKSIHPEPVLWGLKMFRSYQEHFAK